MAQGAARRRRAVLAAWLVLVLVVGGLAATFRGDLATTFSIPGIESQEAADLLAREFPVANGGTLRAVFAAPDGSTLADPAVAAAIEASLQQATTVPGVVSVAPLTPSPGGVIGFADVQFLEEAQAVPPEAKDQVSAAMEAARSAGLQVEFGGSASFSEVHIGGIAEVAGLAVAAVVLLVTLGTVVAAGLPLITALIGVAVGVLSVYALSSVIEMSNVSSTLALMIGLAVGIDYALFIVARHREQLADPTMSVLESIGRAIGTAGSAVVFAGLTVVIALSALSIAGVPFLTIMGLAAAGTVAVAVAVALTLIPALLGFAGERLRPRSARRAATAPAAATEATLPEARGGVWLGWARMIQRAPAVVLAVATALLLVLSLPVLDLRLGLPGNETQPEDSTLYQSYHLLTEGFGPGFNATILYVIDGEGQPAEQVTATANELAATIGQDPGVLTVTPPVLNPARSIAILNVVPLTGPDDEATTELVQRLRGEPRAVVEATGATAYVAGQTPAAIDVSDKLSDALAPFIIVIVGLALLLLIVAFRSLVVPVKAVLGFLLTIGSSIGVTVWVFQQGNLLDLFGVTGGAPIVAFVPVILIGVLFGLAMDYEVFIVSRMREEFHHTGDATRSVLQGMGQNGRVVAAAALIMTSVFGGFVFTPDPIIKSIAFALALGVLIDAFVVRMTIVPAVMFLLGRRAWALPGWLDRIIPNVDIEGASLPAHRPMASASPNQRAPGESLRGAGAGS
jgi:RND superfamily putative drug exporter